MARVELVVLPAVLFWRRQRGLTQEGLARRIAMRRNTIWRIEAGFPTRARTAHLVATALRVGTAELTADVSAKQPGPPTLTKSLS